MQLHHSVLEHKQNINWYIPQSLTSRVIKVKKRPDYIEFSIFPNDMQRNKHSFYFCKEHIQRRIRSTH